MEKKDGNGQTEWEKRKHQFQVEMYRYGYTKENLFSADGELRIPLVALKVVNQTLMLPKYSYQEADNEYLVTLYVTKELAENLPKQVFMKVTYDDGRSLYANEEDLYNEKAKPLLVSMGSGWVMDYVSVPHILTENEINQSLYERHLIDIE